MGINVPANLVANNTVLFGPFPLTSFVDDGTTRAIESNFVREATDPEFFTDGVCGGEPAGNGVRITLRVIRGTATDEYLRGRIGDVDTFSVTPNGLAPGLATSRYFYRCAQVFGGDAGPQIGSGTKVVEYTVFAERERGPDLNIVAP